jgi:hypothetical protein
MGLFEDIGRKVGKISHEAKEATREQATAQCADCETLIYSDRDTCPDCGSEHLVSRGESEEAGTSESPAGDSESEEAGTSESPAGDSESEEAGTSESPAGDSGSEEAGTSESPAGERGAAEAESTGGDAGDSGSDPDTPSDGHSDA